MDRAKHENDGIRMAAIEIGVTTVLTGAAIAYNGFCMANLAVLPQVATIKSLSLHIRVAGGDIRLGIYDDTGASGGPGALKAESASTNAPTAGVWLTLPVVTPVVLQPDNYWLSFQQSNNTVRVWEETSGGSHNYDFHTYGAHPTPFTIDGGGVYRFSLSAQLETHLLPPYPVRFQPRRARRAS